MLFITKIHWKYIAYYIDSIPKNEIDHLGYLSYKNRLNIIIGLKHFSKERFSTSLYWAVREGHLNIVKYLYYINAFNFIHEEIIAQDGHRNVVRFLRSIRI
jgi:hypothetical protein